MRTERDPVSPDERKVSTQQKHIENEPDCVAHRRGRSYQYKRIAQQQSSKVSKDQQSTQRRERQHRGSTRM